MAVFSVFFVSFRCHSVSNSSSFFPGIPHFSFPAPNFLQLFFYISWEILHLLFHSSFLGVRFLGLPGLAGLRPVERSFVGEDSHFMFEHWFWFLCDHFFG